ncbi:MAG: 5'-nucleotidase C-terminal domain-containing protein [Candidatus Marinimicrobia bacterium]|nr:5'-nucleotidase C-terminal domain-containing protein [Candidatus Neomarinimicrobiota bacterium]
MKKIFSIIIITFLFFCNSFALNDTKATILYFNDAHEISPVKDKLGERGGVARIKTVVDKVKETNPETIVLFGGDLGGGSLFGAVFHGFPIVEAFNKIPIDIANFGQHDFDFGEKVTRELVEKSEFQWITSNLVDTANNSFMNLPKYKIINSNNLKIGFIGLTDAMNTTIVRNTVIQNDLFKSAEHSVEKLKKKNVDFIIAITQTGQKNNEKLLENIPDIDAIFSEEIYENRTNVFYVDNRPIITTCGNLGSIARLDIYNDNIYVRNYSIDAKIQSEPKLLKLQNHYQNKLENKLSKPIAILRKKFDAGINGDFKGRWRETNIGNFLTDSYRKHYKSDIAILNGGGIRANIESGEFTTKDALSIIPFGNRICLVEISGRYILEALEHGVSSIKNSGSLLQISGASYEYDWNKTTGNMVSNVKIQGLQLEMNKIYSLALPDYLLFGGDGYNIFDHCKIIVQPESAPKDIEIFRRYCQEMKILNPKIENRITVINKNKYK